jgi:hypothetical protein
LIGREKSFVKRNGDSKESKRGLHGCTKEKMYAYFASEKWTTVTPPPFWTYDYMKRGGEKEAMHEWIS